MSLTHRVHNLFTTDLQYDESHTKGHISVEEDTLVINQKGMVLQIE